MITAQKMQIKKVGMAAVTFYGAAMMAATTTLALAYANGKRKQKKQTSNPYLSIADYNAIVRHYNVAVVMVNQQIEEQFPDLPKLRPFLEQMETEEFNEMFDEIMKNW